jgi:hypothetical protein
MEGIKLISFTLILALANAKVDCEKDIFPRTLGLSTTDSYTISLDSDPVSGLIVSAGAIR